MDKPKQNICVLFDFENIEVSLRKHYQLSLKQEGFNRIIDYVKTLGNVQKKNIYVGAFWNNFSNQKTFAVKMGIPIDVVCNTKSAADGALIVEGMKFFTTESTTIDKFVIVAGDGGYGNLVQFLFQEDKEVSMISNKKSTNSDLKKLIGDHKFVDDILNLNNGSSFDDTLVQPMNLTEEIKSVINKAKGLKHMTHLHKTYLEKQILKASSKHKPFKPYDTIEKCRDLVSKCCEMGIFNEYPVHTNDGKEVMAVKLNELNLLVIGVENSLTTVTN